MNTKSPEELNARVALLESTLEVEKATVANYFKTIMALEADRKKLEAEVRRLTDEAGRKHEYSGCFNDKGSVIMTASESTEVARACARRELEMTAHEREELIRYKRLMAEVRSIMRPQHMEMVDGKSKCTDFSDEEMVESLKNEVKRMATVDVNQRIDHSNSVYWQEKYHELKRLKAIEDKVAADQVASLQKKLEAVNAACDTSHCELKMNWELRVMVQELKAQLKEAKDLADTFRASENEVGESYVRIRKMVGAMDAGPGGVDRFSVTEGKVRSLIDDVRMYKSAVEIAEKDIADLKAQLEGARARAAQEAEENLNRCRGYANFSESPAFGMAIHKIGAEILEINRGNGWDVTKPSDWPKHPDDDNASGTAKVRKLMTNLALIHSEVSEAAEAVRKLDRKNFEEELADVVIRTLDTSHGLGIDLGPVICAKLKKNRGRGHKHGGKAV